MTSLEIREFKQAISNFVASSELPAEVKRLVLKEVLTEQENTTLCVMRDEIKARDLAESAQNENAE